LHFFSKNTRFFSKKTAFFWDFLEKQIKLRRKKVPGYQLRHNLVTKTKKQSKNTTNILIMQI